MSTDTAKYMTPDQAMDNMIEKAIARKGGALSADYSAHFKREADAIQSERAINGELPLDVSALAIEVKKTNPQWVNSVRDDYKLSQGQKEGVDVPPEAAQGFMGSLMNGGGFGGAISGLLLTLKPIKDFMSVILKVALSWIGSKFSDKVEFTSWSDAWKEIETKDKTMAAINVFTAKGRVLDPNTFAAELNTTPVVEPAATPDATPAAAPAAAQAQAVDPKKKIVVAPSIVLDENFKKSTLEAIQANNSEAFDNVRKAITNGGFAVSGTDVLATPDALAALNQVPQEAWSSSGGKTGDSWDRTR